MKKLDDLFLSIDQPIFAIAQVKVDGLDIIVTLYEQQLLKWNSIGAVRALAVGQIIAGTILLLLLE
jgi:hypothetical protein